MLTITHTTRALDENGKIYHKATTSLATRELAPNATNNVRFFKLADSSVLRLLSRQILDVTVSDHPKNAFDSIYHS